MTTRTCSKCGGAPCICRPFCPGKRQCCNTQHMQYNCAGPLILTGEDDIGSRPCCNGYKKCSDKHGFKKWCSHTGKCPGEESTWNYPPAPQPFTQYYDFLVQENFSKSSNKKFMGVL